MHGKDKRSPKAAIEQRGQERKATPKIRHGCHCTFHWNWTAGEKYDVIWVQNINNVSDKPLQCYDRQRPIQGHCGISKP